MNDFPILMSLSIDERRIALMCAELRVEIAQKFDLPTTSFGFSCQYKNVICDTKKIKQLQDNLKLYENVFPAVVELRAAVEADTFIYYRHD